MTNLVRYCVRQCYAIIFVDAARLPGMTHAANVWQSQNPELKTYTNDLFYTKVLVSSYAQLDLFVQMSCRLIRIATSWCLGWFSSISLFWFCHLTKFNLQLDKSYLCIKFQMNSLTDKSCPKNVAHRSWHLTSDVPRLPRPTRYSPQPLWPDCRWPDPCTAKTPYSWWSWDTFQYYRTHRRLPLPSRPQQALQRSLDGWPNA